MHTLYTDSDYHADMTRPPFDTVLQGDCRDRLAAFPDGSFDFVLTDPPYLVNYVARDGRSIKGDTNGEWLDRAFAEIFRTLRDNSYCVSFYGWSKVGYFMRAWRRAGFRPVGHFVWAKPYASAENRVRYCHEQAYLLAKGNPPRPSLIIPDVLDWQYSGNHLHPTQKPVSALLPLVLAFTKPNDAVLDPFCGSGSALVAAKLLGRRYVGVELDEKFAAAAAKRLTSVAA
jgi:adenine-specific DNA-methyltransferase